MDQKMHDEAVQEICERFNLTADKDKRYIDLMLHGAYAIGRQDLQKEFKLLLDIKS